MAFSPVYFFVSCSALVLAILQEEEGVMQALQMHIETSYNSCPKWDLLSSATLIYDRHPGAPNSNAWPS